MKALYFFIISLLIAQSIPTWADDTAIDVGPGALICKTYTKKNLEGKSDYILWVQGFFSAFNALDPDTKNITGTKDYNWVRQWFDNYCKLNPEEYFGRAVRVLIDDLYPSRIASEKAQGLGIKNPEKLTDQEAKAIIQKIRFQ